MAAPILQAEVDINAPVTKVWELISDLTKMPQWSPQCRVMKPLGEVRQGARTVNVNRRGRLFWPTTCRITEFVPLTLANAPGGRADAERLAALRSDRGGPCRAAGMVECS